MQNTGFGKLFSISRTKSYRLQENTPRSSKAKRKFTHDEWQAFLIPFRKLLLNGDPANLFRVMNILSRIGSRKDQVRLRAVKRRLKEVATSPGYGIRMMTKENGQWVQSDGKKILENYLNTVIFHNDSMVITDGGLAQDMHPFAILSMFHYVVLTYKQTLRIAGAIRIRYGV